MHKLFHNHTILATYICSTYNNTCKVQIQPVNLLINSSSKDSLAGPIPNTFIAVTLTLTLLLTAGKIMLIEELVVVLVPSVMLSPE